MPTSCCLAKSLLTDLGRLTDINRRDLAAAACEIGARPTLGSSTTVARDHIRSGQRIQSTQTFAALHKKCADQSGSALRATVQLAVADSPGRDALGRP